MKVKTLMKKLKTYDPNLRIVVMVSAELESKGKATGRYEYAFAGKSLKVKRDKTVCKGTDCVLVYGDIEEILQG